MSGISILVFQQFRKRNHSYPNEPFPVSYFVPGLLQRTATAGPRS